MSTENEPHLARLKKEFSFSDGHLATLVAILDTVLQAEPASSAPSLAPSSSQSLAQLMPYSFTSIPDFTIDHLAKALLNSITPASITQIRIGLSLLNNRLATYLLSGHYAPFADIPIGHRQRILAAWSTSKLALKRQLFGAFTTLPLSQIYGRSRVLATTVGYPIDGEPRLVTHPDRRVPSYPFRFRPFPEIDAGSTTIPVLDTDVVVIGSGAGGAVVSSLVAQAGFETLVIEKGTYVPTEKISGSPIEASQMFEGNGLMTTSDGNMIILAGATFGGGTTVNWSASIVPPFHIRRAWAEEHGLDYFSTDAFADDLKHVTDRLGVSTDSIVHSKSNQLFVNGCRKIGVHVDQIPQNTAGRVHDCGMCSNGCPFGEKQSAPRTWLKDCAEAGGQFMQAAHVDRILFSDHPNPAHLNPDPASSTPSVRRRFAVGVLVSEPATSKRLVVRARRAVVCSAGAISSPAVLLRSGLALDGRVGKGLHLHPVSFVTGWFDEPIRPWEGSIMTAISCEVENLAGDHYGCKIEVIASSTTLYAGVLVPWRSSAGHKAAMAQYAHSFSLVIICRDHGSGQVTVDPLTGKPVVDYPLSAFDGHKLTEGVVVGCRIMRAAGARTVATSQSTVQPFLCHNNEKLEKEQETVQGDDVEEEDEQVAFDKWLGKVRKAGVKAGWGPLGTAHQMSSCKMGSPSSKISLKKNEDYVVDQNGKVIGTEKLWIADGSVLPTSTGVNPSITIMGVSYSIGKKLVDHLKSNQQHHQDLHHRQSEVSEKEVSKL